MSEQVLIGSYGPASSGPIVSDTPDRRPARKHLIVIDWQVSSYHGWGVLGLNMMLNWASRQGFMVCSSLPVDPGMFELNPIERWLMDPLLINSKNINSKLQGLNGTARMSCAVLHALGNNLSGVERPLRLVGTPSIAMVFFEWSSFDTTARDRASRFPLIVVGSSWNKDVLAALGINQVAVVLQGIDAGHFHPGPRMGWFGDHFAVFSGGKLERRKGQDLVLQAFRIFAERHRDALLVTAWHSLWPQLARSLNVNPSVQPVPFTDEGRIDAFAWTQANGISPQQVFHLGPVPNAQVAHVLREMDVALFPNRAEGGTNLVAMECMACGVPTILSANTGHRDLIDDGNCFALTRQGRVGDPGCQHWGESNIEEILEMLELAYCDRTEANARGRRGAEMMASLTWARQLDKLAEVIRPYLA
jgi:glycosyltransferase involved in cell wall biosynthesis